ncbi:MAG: TrpR-related protein YerC/YecD [Clostridia bacterium]|nr:TrpR-related protein YerC/YecD [Clostridia bacterium]
MLTELYTQIIKIQSVEECAAFFEDLCTIKELESMSQRIVAAQMLIEGKTYNEIIEKTEISSATLSRVSKCVRYGEGGYKNVITK